MPGMFDGFQLNIFDDAIFDTVLDDPPALQIRQVVSNGVPATVFSNQVVDA